MDLSATVSDERLERVGLVKGSRTVVNSASTSSSSSLNTAHPGEGAKGDVTSDWHTYLGADADDEAEGGGRGEAEDDNETQRRRKRKGSSGFSLNAGGSASNTLAAVALLCRASHALPHNVRVGMGGIVGSDVMGSYFVAEMERAGVDFVSQPIQGTTTGKCVVLTTPDAHRTLVSDFGNAMGVLRSFDTADDELQAMLRPAALEEALCSSALLLVEGYLFEMGDAVVESMIASAARTAKACGSFVAMTASDASVVRNHRRQMRNVLAADVDLLFGNVEEAIELAGGAGAVEDAKRNAALRRTHFANSHSDKKERGAEARRVSTSAASSTSATMSDAEAAARALGEQFPMCRLIAVTDGHRGSYIYSNVGRGQLYVIPPCWTKAPPVDTCGAGDAYAAGIIYSLLRGTAAATAAATSVWDDDFALMGSDDENEVHEEENKRKKNSRDEADQNERISNAIRVTPETVHAMGMFAARTASRVIMKEGPRLTLADAEALVVERHRDARPVTTIYRRVRSSSQTPPV